MLQSPVFDDFDKLTVCPSTVQLMPETLFLTMNVIDRFLEQKPMTRKNLQLVSSLIGPALALHWLRLPMK